VPPREVSRRDILHPFLSVLEGGPARYGELVASGRMLAQALVTSGRPISICEDYPWAGVWDLERLTDGEAVDWDCGWLRRPGGG
jgi:hypothetical protein